MKKTLATLMAIVLLLVCGSAFATTGWANSTDAKTYKNFKVEITCYEGREDSSGLSLSSYVSGGAANEITGRVVIGTTVIIIVKVTVPKQENTDLLDEDYVNAQLNLVLGNLDVTGTATGGLAGASPNFYSGTDLLACESGTPGSLYASYTENTEDEDYDLELTVTDAADNTASVVYTFAVVGQAKSTAECPVTATFTMGQNCSVDPYYVEFSYDDKTYQAGFATSAPTAGSVTFTGVHNYFVLTETDTGNVLYFTVNSSNKLSAMHFYFDGNSSAYEGLYTVDSCGTDGGIKFVDDSVSYCACNGEVVTGVMEDAFQRLLDALGFDYTRGSVDFGYATTSDVNGLANQVKVAAGYTFNECTELAIVDVPQTGSMTFGVAVIAMALVAASVVSIRKLRA